MGAIERAGKEKSVSGVSSRDSGLSLLAGVILLVAILAAYLPSFTVPFIYDDHPEIVQNDALSDLHDVKRIVTYNPSRALLMLTFALERAAFGLESTSPFHVTNLLIHLINAFLVFQIGLRLLERPAAPPLSRWGLEVPAAFPAALSVALLFAVHPLQLEGVTYIASRSSSLTALFYLGAFLAYIRFRAPATGTGIPSWAWLALASNLYLLSVLTKEEGVSLPAVLLAYDLLLAPRPSHDSKSARGFWLGTFPFWVLFLMLIVFRVFLFEHVLPPVEGQRIDNEVVAALYPPVEVRSIGENLLTALKVLFAYLRLLVVPAGLNIYHDFPTVSSPLQASVVLAAIGHIGLLLLAWMMRRRIPLLSFAIVFFYIVLSPTTSIIPLKEIMAEHRMYLAGVGFFLYIGALLETLTRRNRLLWIGVVVVGLGLGVQTFLLNRIWQDEVHLWQRAVTLSPHSGDAYFALGEVLMRKNRLAEAEDAYLRSVDAYIRRGIPGDRYTYSYVDALNNLGLVHARQGNMDVAISYYRRALQERPSYASAWTNLGFAEMQRGLYLEASFAFEEAVRLKPDNWLPHYHLGDLYYDKLPDRKRAAYHYRRFLEIDPQVKYREAYRRRVQERLLELGL